MQFPAAEKEDSHPGCILHQRIAADAHEPKYPGWQESNSHNDHLCRRWQWDPHQLRISDEQQQEGSFYRMSRLKHAAEQFA